MTQTVYMFSGEVRWAKVYQVDEKYGKYSIDIKLNDSDATLFQSLGLKNGFKDGYVSLRRDPNKLVWKNDAQVPLGALPVIDSSGNPIKDKIGNGSICTVKFVVNEFVSKKWGPVKSTWVDAVRVDTLVKYEGGNSVSPASTTAQPRELF